MTNDKERERLVKLMRDRLIELMQEWGNKNTDSFPFEGVADYLLENGVIVPPCKVGDAVWVNSTFGTIKARVVEIIVDVNNKFLMKIHYDLIYCYKERINTKGQVGYTEDKFEFGKTVFLTKEEAEKALGGVK